MIAKFLVAKSKIGAAKIAAVGVAACLLAIAAGTATAHEPRGLEDYRLVVGFAQEPAFEGLLNGVSLRVTKPAEAADSGDSGGHSHGGNAHGGGSHDGSHGKQAAMSHDEAIALDDAVSIALETDVDDDGGVNVRILTDNWVWSPENVNGEHIAGEGHAHIYADGVKLNRVYGHRYHISGLEAGEREIRVTLNANSHNELTVNGEPLEAALTVNVPSTAHAHVAAHPQDAIAADGAMSIDAMAHLDAPGEYNLQVATSGFAFGDGNGGGGDGYALVSIDGEAHARMQSAWHKLPKLDAGEHTIGVALMSNADAPYAWQGAPVEASVVVHIAEDGGDAAQAGAAMAGTGAMAMAMDHADDMVAVEGLAATLQVEVTHIPTGASRVMALHAVSGDAGHYVADFIPTASGQYSFHFTGSIEGVAVDETFESGADKFNNVEPANAIQFPERAASAREVEAASRGAIEAAQQALGLAASAGGAADSARLLGIVGIVVGAVGVVIGGVAALLAMRRR